MTITIEKKDHKMYFQSRRKTVLGKQILLKPEIKGKLTFGCSVQQRKQSCFNFLFSELNLFCKNGITRRP